MVYMLQGVERMLKTIAEKAADKLVLSGDKRQVAGGMHIPLALWFFIHALIAI